MPDSGNTYADSDRAALSALLGGQGVRVTKVGTPVTTTDGHNAELGNDDGSANSCSDFFGGLDAQANVAFRVSDDNDGLESSTLTRPGLFLDGLDLRLEAHQPLRLSQTNTG